MCMHYSAIAVTCLLHKMHLTPTESHSAPANLTDLRHSAGGCLK